MIINHNMNAMNAHRNMMGNTVASGKSMEKLSSGLRINRAGDDAAGLAISEKMRAQVRGLDQASRNSQDGISMIQTAEGGLNETHSILQRMRELATQAANDTNVDVDRKEIHKEMNQLTSEINRIGNTTEFNTQKVLKGKEATGTVGSVTNVEGVAGTAGTKGTNTLTIATALTAGETIVVGGKTITAYATAAAKAAANSGAGDANGIAIDTAGTAALQATAVGALFAADADLDATVTGTAVKFTQKVAGTGDVAAATGTGVTSTHAANSATTAGVAGTAKVGSTDFTITKALAQGETLKVAGQTITVYADATARTAAKNGAGDAYGILATDTAAAQATAIKAMTFTGSTATGTGAQIKIAQNVAGTGDVTGPVIDAGNFKATLQIGANQGQGFEVEINDMRSAALKVSGKTAADTTGVTDAKFVATASVSDGTDSNNTEFALDVSSNKTASAAIKVINNAIETVSAERSKLGAYQNRLEHTIANLGTSSENLQSAESRVRDVDMAKEMMAFSKNNILSQASQAMLAQAKSQPEAVLQLLR